MKKLSQGSGLEVLVDGVVFKENGRREKNPLGYVCGDNRLMLGIIGI